MQSRVWAVASGRALSTSIPYCLRQLHNEAALENCSASLLVDISGFQILSDVEDHEHAAEAFEEGNIP